MAKREQSTFNVVKLFDRSIRRTVGLLFGHFKLKLPCYDDKTERNRKRYINNLLNCSMRKFKVVVALSANQEIGARSYGLEVDLLNYLCQASGLNWNKILFLLEKCPELYTKLPKTLQSNFELVQHVVKHNVLMISEIKSDELSWHDVLNSVRSNQKLFNQCLIMMREKKMPDRAVAFIKETFSHEEKLDLEQKIKKINNVNPLTLKDRQKEIRIKLGHLSYRGIDYQHAICNILDHNPSDIIYISDEHLGHSHYVKALSAHGCLLKYINSKKIDVNHCVRAVCQSGVSLQYVPRKFRVSGVYHAALDENAQSLYHIPNHWLAKHPNILIDVLYRNFNNQFEVCSYPSVQEAVEKNLLLRYMIKTLFPKVDKQCFKPIESTDVFYDGVIHYCLKKPSIMACLSIRLIVPLVLLMESNHQMAVLKHLPLWKRGMVNLSILVYKLFDAVNHLGKELFNLDAGSKTSIDIERSSMISTKAVDKPKESGRMNEDRKDFVP